MKIELDLTQREADELREHVDTRYIGRLPPDKQSAVIKLQKAIDRASRG